jgi:hypothetical protein
MHHDPIEIGNKTFYLENQISQYLKNIVFKVCQKGLNGFPTSSAVRDALQTVFGC